jgi:hypothetical protein
LAAADGLLLEYGPWSASGVLGKAPAKFMHEREAAVPGSTIVRGTGDDWQQSHAAAGCGGRKHRYVSHMVARPSEDLWRVSTAGALATRSICKCFWMNAFLRLKSVALDAVWRFGGAWVAPFVTGLPGIEYHGHVAAGVTVHILAARSAILFTLGIFCTAVRYGSELLEIGGIDGPVRQLAWGCIAAVAIVTFRVAQAPAQLRSASIFATVAGWAVSVLRDSGFSADNWMVNSMLTALFFTYLWVQAVGTCPELGNGRLGGVVPIMVAAAAYNNRNVRGWTSAVPSPFQTGPILVFGACFGLLSFMPGAFAMPPRKRRHQNHVQHTCGECGNTEVETEGAVCVGCAAAANGNCPHLMNRDGHGVQCGQKRSKRSISGRCIAHVGKQNETTREATEGAATFNDRTLNTEMPGLSRLLSGFMSPVLQISELHATVARRLSRHEALPSLEQTASDKDKARDIEHIIEDGVVLVERDQVDTTQVSTAADILILWLWRQKDLAAGADGFDGVGSLAKHVLQAQANVGSSDTGQYRTLCSELGIWFQENEKRSILKARAGRELMQRQVTQVDIPKRGSCDSITIAVQATLQAAAQRRSQMEESASEHNENSEVGSDFGSSASEASGSDFDCDESTPASKHVRSPVPSAMSALAAVMQKAKPAASWSAASLISTAKSAGCAALKGKRIATMYEDKLVFGQLDEVDESGMCSGRWEVPGEKSGQVQHVPFADTEAEDMATYLNLASEQGVRTGTSRSSDIGAGGGSSSSSTRDDILEKFGASIIGKLDKTKAKAITDALQAEGDLTLETMTCEQRQSLLEVPMDAKGDHSNPATALHRRVNQRFHAQMQHALLKSHRVVAAIMTLHWQPGDLDFTGFMKAGSPSGTKKDSYFSKNTSSLHALSALEYLGRAFEAIIGLNFAAQWRIFLLVVTDWLVYEKISVGALDSFLQWFLPAVASSIQCAVLANDLMPVVFVDTRGPTAGASDSKAAKAAHAKKALNWRSSNIGGMFQDQLSEMRDLARTDAVEEKQQRQPGSPATPQKPAKKAKGKAGEFQGIPADLHLNLSDWVNKGVVDASGKKCCWKFARWGNVAAAGGCSKKACQFSHKPPVPTEPG